LGFVYFIRCPANGLIKIGYTADHPDMRLNRYRLYSPVPIEPMGVIRGEMEAERGIHARFRDLWSHGEWFRSSPELVAFIEAEAAPWPARQPKRKRSLVGVPMPVRVVAEWARITPLTCQGVTRPVVEWAALTGMTPHKIKCQLERGMTPDDAFFWLSVGKFRVPRAWYASVP
jgi:hypothetical protein